ncbi:hypothetical protein GCM10020219_080920 [Nonomuraea dietziae]
MTGLPGGHGRPAIQAVKITLPRTWRPSTKFGPSSPIPALRRRNVLVTGGAWELPITVAEAQEQETPQHPHGSWPVNISQMTEASPEGLWLASAP